MTTADLLRHLASMPPDAVVVVVTDAFDTDICRVELGTTPENEPCCWLVTNHAEEAGSDD